MSVLSSGREQILTLRGICYGQEKEKSGVDRKKNPSTPSTLLVTMAQRRRTQSVRARKDGIQ